MLLIFSPLLIILFFPIFLNSFGRLIFYGKIFFCRKRTYICDALRDLVQSVQFKRPWRSVTSKVTLLHGCFSRFLNCTNGTKSSKTSHIYLHFVDARVGENLGHAMFKVLASVDSTKNILIKLVMQSLCILFFMFQLKGLSLSNSDVIKQVHNSFAR